MNLPQFYDSVKRALRRGNAFDDVIPDWVAESANLLEQDYTYSWMWKNALLTLEAPAAELEDANRVALPSTRVKAIEWVKMIVLSNSLTGEVVYGDDLVGVDASRFTGISYGPIQGYYVDGSNYLVFDGIPLEDTQFAVRYAEYTEWPTSAWPEEDEEEVETPALLVRGQSLLKSETLLLYAQEQRDMKMAELYSNRRDRALSMLQRSEEELKLSFQNDLVMRAG